MSKLENEARCIAEAIAGNHKALELLLSSVQDAVFNLSLRMLGMIPDAEDATQEILIKVMTHLSSLRGECSFSTWVFRIALNHLKSCRKGLFAQRPLSFEVYGEDIASGREQDVPDLGGGVDRALLERELKLSCSNVMLQCLDAESRCVYILGTMFRLDSRVAAEILEITPEAYRQRLSRVRKKMGAFLSEYCGLSGTGLCACARRTDYAIATHRLNPAQLAFQSLDACGYAQIADYADAMDEIDGLSQVFANLPAYRSPRQLSDWIKKALQTGSFSMVLNRQEAAR